MNDFWMICAYDNYYPVGGIRNIKVVLQGDYEDAVKALDSFKNESKYSYDYYEILNSDELPWVKNEEQR
jgi:hypothetical protein